MDFETALAAFHAALQAHMERTYADSPTANPLVTKDPGSQKYVRFCVSSWTSKSVCAFVRIEDGAILYPAGWKKPYIAKAGPYAAPATVRGSIYAEDHGMSAMGRYSVRTL